MTTLTPTQVADLRRKIEARYQVQDDDAGWFVADAKTWDAINANNHENYNDAEAEMEAIIQDEVKAATKEQEEDVA